MTDARRSFKVFRIADNGGTIAGAIVDATLDELSPGDVVIAAEYSSVNYKDALAATGAAKILKRMPLVGGIDVAGTVASSTDARFREGDQVLVTGYDLGVAHDGGYAAYVRVPADWVVKIARRPDRARRDDDRHGRLHRCAVRHPPRTERPHAGFTAPSSSRARPAASAASRSQFWRRAATR